MTEDAVSLLKALYERIPKVACKRKCQQACGPVFDQGGVTRLEADRVFALHGHMLPRQRDGLCGYLDDVGRCGIYAQRPLVCRMWGTIDMGMMRCPHGCEPERWLDKDEARAIVDEAKALGGQFSGTDAGAAARLVALAQWMAAQA